MDINFHSAEWQAIYAEATKKIQEHTQSLLGYGCDQAKADYLRGRIEALRELIERDAARFKSFSIKPFN